LQQLESCAQVAPSGKQPAAQVPLLQRPLQHCLSVVQGEATGTQAHSPPLQVPTQQSLSERHE